MDGPPPPEEDFSSMTISERLSHKNWKARVSAYEALVKTFSTTASDDDPAFKPYTNNPDLLKKIVTDSNAVAQEKGLECLVALVKFAGENASKTRESVVPALVDKCFGSSRTGTKAQALELVLQYVEVENGGTGVMNDILPGLSAKQPKTVAGCVVAIKEIVRIFGTQNTSPPPVLKALPKIFAHTDKTVRAEGTALTHVLYQYLGPGIESWLNDLKPVQVKELKEAFENMEKEGKGKGSVKPERLTRAQAREVESTAVNDRDNVGEGGSVDTGLGDEPVDLDPRAFAEPVDIVPKLPSTLSTALMSAKWKERKEVLDELSTLLTSTPRIKEAPELGEVAKALAIRIQGDANINCVMTAASCMEALAKGMMTSFARYRETVVPPMLERLKERKANVTDTIGAALDAVFVSTTLADIVPDLKPALTSKNPQVKEGTLKFLRRCLSTAKTPIPSPEIKPLADVLSTLLEDSFEGARNEAASCMGTLMKMVGERPFNAVIEGLADVRKAKIKEAYEKATVKCKAGAGGGPPKAAPPKPAAGAAPMKKALPSNKPPVVARAPPKPADTLGAEELEQTAPPKKPLAKPPARLLKEKITGGGAAALPAASATPTAKKPPPAVAAVAAAKSTKAAPPTAPGALDTFKYKHTPEDAEALATDLIPANIMTDLTDANWKTRLAALDEMTPWLEGIVDDVDAEVVIRALAKKGWAEKNFQVSTKIYGVCALLAERSKTFGRSCVALCVPHLSEKLGDMKLKKPAGDTLLLFAERTSLQFVLNQAYDSLSKQKAPKMLADAITWINSALTEFGIAGLSLRSMIEFLKAALQNSNATVRTSATKTLVTLRLFAGSSIKDLLEDLNPQLLNTITVEFDKVEGTGPPEPIRVSADVAAMPTSTPTSRGGASGGADALDELFPRVDIDALLKGTTILADTKSDAWKTKKEALEALQAILDQGSNKRLKPTMGEIAQVLKARVVDTNKAVQTLALDIVARIATGMGKPFEKQNKFFVLPVATVLADQKAPIRNAALQTLTAIAIACEGLDSMIPGLTSGLETTNPLQKGTLLKWVVEWFKEHELPSSLDLSNWTGPVVSSLDDRNSDIRKAAQAILPTLIASAGFDFVMQQTNSLKPAARNTAVPLIQAARPTQAAIPVVSAPPPAVPPVKVKPPTPSVVQPPAPSPTEDAAPRPPANKLTGVRRKLPLGSNRPESRAETPVEAPATAGARVAKPPLVGLKRPGTSLPSSKATSTAPSPGPSLPLIGSNSEARKGRCGKDTNRWINEGGPTRKDLADLLQSQMEAHTSKELCSRLFSHDHNAINNHIAGLVMLCETYNAAQAGDDAAEAVCLANFDFPLKYVSMKLHEPQPNLISKCLELVEAVIAFLRHVNYQLTDNEALCFIPTVIHKLGDAREQARVRVQQIIQSLPKIYAYSRVFHLLLDHGLKSKVAKTRQGALDELGNLLKKYGMTACEPTKAFPVVASMISDKDSAVRKSALGTISEGYVLVGEKVWSSVGPLAPKDKTQLEERLRRVAGPSGQEKAEAPVPSQISRLAGPGSARPSSPAFTSRLGGVPRPASPVVSGPSKIGRPTSPAHDLRSDSPTPLSNVRTSSPSRPPKMPVPSHPTVPPSPTTAKGFHSGLPSRLGRPRTHLSQPASQISLPPHDPEENADYGRTNEPELPVAQAAGPEDITLTISSILSSDPIRSVDALKKVQSILNTGASGGPQYSELAEHTEGLIETITLQMAHIFERPEALAHDENFRLAKHLIQTLNNFCDHPVLAESLTVDILTALLEELTLRLLETDDSSAKQVKDLSRFINMIILRMFAMGRRMSIFRALFALLLQIVKPFIHNGVTTESKEAKVAELVLKCVWKLARSIPQDLTEQKLDPVELFPTIEHFLQSVPPNDWRARATNKIPCGDMPLRTIKVIIQHVVAHYGDDVYDLLSAAFDDPSATIVYPYVYRILNSSSRGTSDIPSNRIGGEAYRPSRPLSTTSSRAISPTASSASASHRNSSPGRPDSFNGHNIYSPPSEEPDPDAQLLTIIGHISSETTGALHKEGITELHQFLKAYPHKKPRVDKLLESTGAAFRKYINRALASRAAEDEERNAAVGDTLTKLESTRNADPSSPQQPEPSPRSSRSVRRPSPPLQPDAEDKLSRLHNIFQYRSSTLSNGSSQGESSTPRTSFS